MKKRSPNVKARCIWYFYKTNEIKKGYYQYNSYLINALVFIVGATRFELATPTTPLWCATGLRHAPIY